MSKPVFQDVFKFSGRRNRQSYILFQVAVWFIVGVISLGGLGLIAAVGDGGFAAAIIFGVMVVALIATVIAAWATSAQRVRDFGYSGVWALVQLIPYIGVVAAIAIMLVPSTEGDNKYGPSCI